MVSFFPLTVAVIGIGSFSLGPTQPFIVWRVCFSDALPFIVPSDVEIQACQFPVISAAQTGTDNASKSALSSTTRTFMVSPFFDNTKRTRERSLWPSVVS